MEALGSLQRALPARSARPGRRQRRDRAPQAALAEPPASDEAEASRFKAWESPFANRHRRTDLKRIMILGAGPIVIGQARAGSLPPP